MIRFIAAIDSKHGMATDHGIPWQGQLPTDVKYFRKKTNDSMVLMGRGTYVEFKTPLSSRRNLVASSKSEVLRSGFELVNNAREFLEKASEDIWVIGGPGLFTQTLDLANELYLTRLDADFQCTKFFPDFEDRFKCQSSSKPQTENDITFHFEVWLKK